MSRWSTPSPPTCRPPPPTPPPAARRRRSPSPSTPRASRRWPPAPTSCRSWRTRSTGSPPTRGPPRSASPAVHTAGWDGTGRTVAVLDIGVQVDHPYLAGKVTAEACFSHATFAGQVESLCPGEATESHGAGSAAPPCTASAGGAAGCEHGTHVAGIAAGGPGQQPDRPHRRGPRRLDHRREGLHQGHERHRSARGRSPCLLAYDSDIADALDWLSDLRSGRRPARRQPRRREPEPRWRLFSGACDAQVPTITAQVNALRAQGIATVVAAGNSGQNGAAGSPARMASPACISTTVSVGATTNTGAIASYSNLTAGTTILAPGSSIISSKPDLDLRPALRHLDGHPGRRRRDRRAARADPGVVGHRPGRRCCGPTGSPLTTAVGQIPEVQLDSAALGVPRGPPAVDRAGRRRSRVWQSRRTRHLPIGSYGQPRGGRAPRRPTSCTVTGLTNGTTYTFAVVATNPRARHRGHRHAAAPAAQPGTAGGVGGNRRWRHVGRPVRHGGSPITGYIATASPVGRAAPRGHPGCTIIGLANGTSYVHRRRHQRCGGGRSSATPRRRAAVAGVSPFGSFDAVERRRRLGQRSPAGRSTPRPRRSIPVHVYVDGAGTALTANGSRPDVDAAFGYGAGPRLHRHRRRPPAAATRSASTPSTPRAPAPTSRLGCRTVTVPTGPPVGSFDVATAGPGTVSVGGWAIDPDTASPIAGARLRRRRRHGPRPPAASGSDVARPSPAFGGNHGFNGVRARLGRHPHGLRLRHQRRRRGQRRCSAARSSPCRVARRSARSTWPAATSTAPSPSAGWAIDPDTASPIPVHVYSVGPGYPLTGIPP